MPLDAFLDLSPKVTGESTVASHKGWIELTSFEYGIGDSGGAPEDISEELAQADEDERRKILASAQRGREGKFKSVTFSKYVDRASPQLFKFCALYNTAEKAGVAQLPKAVVHLCRYTGKADTKNFVTYGSLQFENCNIQTITIKVSDNGVTSEDIQMSYDKVSFVYNETGSGGGTTGSKTRFAWDVQLNKEWSGAPT
jgi:type VI protein secretion system component Hcp